ncbi:MAG TPA: MBOAT family protein [Sulfuricurvum sp.]|nr:MAG: membrane-bound O-acyltransferase family protein [Campylobacterales bacterium 16-40-21]OZA02871.1 MAG: membrane-bound O-acyltransferase family protein [Sulfuricurvum sp. 17-40-25]HQS67171.1 MBOAT family protein [Sulfuricurvum sp.]HQT36896.1 MBOAT family protein [Sulfuricurvum sp.]
MLFNSYEFIFFFLPISFGIYFWLNAKRLTQASKGWMVFASLFFYSWWNIIYLPLILGSILFNFVIGSTISKMNSLYVTPKNRISKKTLLTFGIVANILLLGFFKYMDFFILNVNTLLNTHLDMLHILLPLGISFFTFTQIAYLVDAYRDEVKEMDYLNYTLFVTFFPHLLAGPILHHKEMMPQFDSLRSKVLNYQNISAGIFLFSIGLFKKVVIADTFSKWANAGFQTTQALNLFEAWATSLSYTFQLYFDFSGYTDMALGVALLFNIKLPMNFNSPYKALNIQDFWRRWHMTLSRFLRDYIYIPLGGNRNGEFRTYSNLFTVFVIGGLWHGASWMFMAWGALHGLAIILHRAWQQMGGKMNTIIAWFITFNFINVTWIFFRADDWSKASNLLNGMLGNNGIILPEKYTQYFKSAHNNHMSYGTVFEHINGSTQTILYIIGGLLITLSFQNSMIQWNNFKSTPFQLIFTLALFITATSMMSRVSEFLYFNF